MSDLRIIGSVLLAGAVCGAALVFAQSRTARPETAAGAKAAPAPGWKLQDLDGKTISSTDLKGKVVILDFWATWCGPCRAEIPGLINLQKRYGKQGLAVIGVSVDQAASSEVKQFAQKAGVNYPVVLADDNTLRAFGGIEAIPTTFIIDREGRIVKRHAGFAAVEQFEKEMKPLL